MSGHNLAGSLSQGRLPPTTSQPSQASESANSNALIRNGILPLLQDRDTDELLPSRPVPTQRASSPGLVVAREEASGVDTERAAERVLSEGQVPTGGVGEFRVGRGVGGDVRPVVPASSRQSLGQLSSGEDVCVERPDAEEGELPPPPCRCAECTARTSPPRAVAGPSTADADRQLERLCWRTVEMMKLENATEEQKRHLVRQLQTKVPSASSSPPEPVEPFPFSLLPLELQIHVMSFLTPHELCNRAALVCRQWAELTRDPTLWQHVAFDAQMAIPTKNVVHILSYSSLLKSLQLEARCDMDKVLFQVADTCPLLRHLTAKFCDGLNSVLLEVLVKNCPLIEHINFEGSRFDDDGCTAALTGLAHLRVLNISHCLRLEDAEIEQIALQCTQLAELNVDGIGFLTDAAVVQLIEKRYQRLQLLALDGENLTDQTFTALGRLQQLSSLSISFADGMSDASVPYIRTLTNLLRLKLKRGQKLSDLSLMSLVANGNMPRLIHLDLSECGNLTDVTVDAITVNCPLLNFLALAWCLDITDAGLENIVNRLRYLRVLDLLGVVRITGDCFSRIPQCLPELRFLNLEQCSSIHDVVVERVVREFPQLQALDYYGDQVVPRPEEMEGWAEELGDDPQPLQLPLTINFMLLSEVGAGRPPA